jgi:hypothetical protein
MQRRLAGRNGGIKSGIARAVAQGEAIIRAQAEGKRALARIASSQEAGGPAEGKQPRTNHNQRFISSSSTDGLAGAKPTDQEPESPKPENPEPENSKPESAKPANQWSRQELDALFARRTAADSSGASGAAPAAPSNEAQSKSKTGG